MRINFVILTSLVLIILEGCFPYYESAEQEAQHAISIQEDEMEGVGPFHVTGTVTLSVDLEIYSGGNVDVYLFDDYHYKIYNERQECTYLVYGSRLNCHGAHFSVKLESGTYYLIIDNKTNSKITGTANPTGPITGMLKLKKL